MKNLVITCIVCLFLMPIVLKAVWYILPSKVETADNTLLTIGKWHWKGIKTWTSGTRYDLGEIVEHNGTLYYVLKRTRQWDSPPSSTYYAEDTKEYRNTHGYYTGDLVIHQGKTYRLKWGYGGTVLIAPPSSIRWSLVSNTVDESLWYRYKIYYEGETVVYGGWTYTAKTTTSGVDPTNTTYWQAAS